jgi:Kelch motif
VGFKTISVASAVQVQPAVVRVEFSSTPKARAASGADDALNPLNWYVTRGGGTALVAPGAVEWVSAYPKKFDLIFATPLAPGAWSVGVVNVATPFGVVVSAPTTAPFTATPPSGYAAFVGLTTPSEADALRSFLNPVLVGEEWDGFVQAVGSGEQRLRDDAMAAFDQLFVPSASGRYLTRLGAGEGVDRPKNAGMKDADFAQLVMALKAGKIQEGALRLALAPFYGSDLVRAFAVSSPEPFALFGGEDLEMLLEEKYPVEALFGGGDFVTGGSATAAEVAAAISRALEAAGSLAWAAPWKSPTDGLTRVKVYDAAVGPKSAIRITGGRAQDVLQFPQPLALLNGSLPTWDVTPNPSDGTATFSAATPGGLDLSGLRSGDYVNVFGGEFQAANRGSFPVLSVSVAYSGSTLVESFVVSNRLAVTQSGLSQVAAASVQYFRPAAQRPSSGPTVSVDGDAVKVTLPATAATVGRGPGSAAYLVDGRKVPVEYVVRVAGVATARAPAHGLSAGSQVIVDGATPEGQPPPTRAGSAGNTNASIASIWSTLSQATPAAVARHAAARLLDGRVLVVGGGTDAPSADPEGAPATCTNAASLLTVTGPTILATGESRYAYSWAADAALPAPHPVCLHKATVLHNGLVFVSGGYEPSLAAVANGSYLYIPGVSTGSWIVGPTLGSAVAGHGQVLLQSGKVLMVGGFDSTFVPLGTCQIYDPTTNAVASAHALNQARTFHSLTLLSDGRVLAAGGIVNGFFDDPPYFFTGSAEIYDPAGDTWTTVGSLGTASKEHDAALLADGRVLVVGGWGENLTQNPSGGAPLSRCEVFDPKSGAWAPAGKLTAPRFPAKIASGFPDGLLRIAGGASAAVDAYDPATGRVRASSAPLAGSREYAEFVASANGAWMLCSGGLDPNTGLPAVDDQLLVPGSEAYSTSGLSGVFRVTGSPTVDTFTYEPGGAEGYAAAGVLYTTLTGGAAMSDLVVTVVATSGFPKSGSLTIEPDTLNAETLPYAVQDATHFAIPSPGVQLTHSVGSYVQVVAGLPDATDMAALASPSGVPGAHIWDPAGASPALTSVSTTSTVALAKGVAYGTLTVADASGFPDAPGWICLAFGRSCQLSPVKYLGRPSPTQLTLDFSTAAANVPSGSSVILLAEKGAFEPDDPQGAGSFYLTDSPAARAGAQAVIVSAAPAGVEVDVEVDYPGDRGLGNEGAPAEGVPKVSDVVEVWAEDVDGEVEAAREGS